MPAKLRKKSSRLLGSNTYGWGKNKHRGGGSRGGRGNAGTGKKAHGKKPSIWGLDYMGKYGFVGRVRRVEKPINLKDLCAKLPRWIHEKKASATEVNLSTLGYTKLLGNGKLSTKLKITVQKAAAKAVEKVKAAGGELVVNE